MKFLSTAIVFVMLCTPAFATGHSRIQLRSPIKIQQVQKVEKVQQVQKVVVEKQIQLYDTVLGVQHNQYFRVQPSNKTLEIHRIEQLISPQKVLIERQEYAPVVVERVVVPQKIIVEQRLQSYRNYCR